jgi:hypothetical protein
MMESPILIVWKIDPMKIDKDEPIYSRKNSWSIERERCPDRMSPCIMARCGIITSMFDGLMKNFDDSIIHADGAVKK